MDQKRLMAAIAISIGILLVFDVYNRATRPDVVLPPPSAQVAPRRIKSLPSPDMRGGLYHAERRAQSRSVLDSPRR